jgi:adenylate cyclase
MVINYAGPAATYPIYSLADVTTGAVSSATFKDKVVLFGVTAAGAEETDTRRTPYGEMARVEISANAIGSILSRAPLVRARGGDILATLVAVGVVAGLLLAQFRPARVFLTGLGLTLVYVVVAWALLTYARLLAPLLPALFVLAASTLVATGIALIQQARSRRLGEALIAGEPV